MPRYADSACGKVLGQRLCRIRLREDAPLPIEHAHVVGHGLEQRSVPCVRGEYSKLERALHPDHDEQGLHSGQVERKARPKHIENAVGRANDQEEPHHYQRLAQVLACVDEGDDEKAQVLDDNPDVDDGIPGGIGIRRAPLGVGKVKVEDRMVEVVREHEHKEHAVDGKARRPRPARP